MCGSLSAELDLESAVILRNSQMFEILFGVVIILIVSAEVATAFAILWYRNMVSLRLSQAPLLAIFVLSGAFATASSYLMLSINDNFCRLREPLTLLSLTLMGNVLTARLWRSHALMSPVLKVGTGLRKQGSLESKSPENNQFIWLKSVEKCLRKYVTRSISEIADRDRIFRCGILISHNKKARSIRQKITLSQMIYLCFVMWLPQLILQLLASLYPPLLACQSYSGTKHLEGVWVSSCNRSAGLEWVTWLGILFAGFPFLLSSVLAYWSQELPRAFNESAVVMSSMRTFMLVILIAGPFYGLSTTPDAKTFSLAVMTLGLVLPLIWLVAVGKLRSMENTTNHGAFLKLDQNGRNRRLIKPDGASSTEKAACLALTIGRLYEEMGLTQTTVRLFDEALDMWRFDPNREESLNEQYGQSNINPTKPPVLAGGYTETEINSFSASDLEFILRLTIAKARVLGTYQAADQKGQKAASQAWVDALHIYERSPETSNLQDRSIIFPIFSGLFVFLKSGLVEDKNSKFEQDLINKFIAEAEAAAATVHLCRALAMKAAFLARFNEYDEAIKIFCRMRDLYVPEEHSNTLTEVYGSDRCAQAFSLSALWQMALGEETIAIDMCDYIIKRLLPKMDGQDIFNSTVLLFPVMRILKFRGQALRMRDIFQQHIMKPYLEKVGEGGSTIWKPLYKPLSILLDLECSICDFKEDTLNLTSNLSQNTLEEYATWIASQSKPLFSQLHENSAYELGWSPYTIICEVCMLLGKCMKQNETLRGEIVKKGLELAREKTMQMLDEEFCEVLYPIAYEVHFPIQSELENLSNL